MGEVFEQIDEKMQTWIEEQQMYFVGTAPLASDGHINCSPKGLDSLAILGPNSAAYLDLTGSGAETIAHLRENGRIVIMFCAFDGAARIVRLHGQGTPIFPGAPGFDELASHFPELPGIRSIIKIDVARVSDSCGYGVPLYDFKAQRKSLVKGWQQRGPEGVDAYQQENNLVSLDGLPAVMAEGD
jgi:hypothetical protein